MGRQVLTALAALTLVTAETHAQRLSALAPAPAWEDLEAYQETITRAEFAHLLDGIYAPAQAATGVIDVGDEAAVIRRNLVPGDTFVLRFAKVGATGKPIPRFWRPVRDIPPGDRPLSGVKIAIDPGHIGGEWARLEERWFQHLDGAPVTEGDLTLRVAQLLAPQLRALGAEVSLVRATPEPVTPVRPENLRDAARSELALEGVIDPPEAYASWADPLRGGSVQFRSELLFFRAAEIRQRAEFVNRHLRPDLLLCLHFDADAWGDPTAPVFTPRNRLHLLMNGTYSAGELRNDDVRLDMLHKLLQRTADEELAANTAVAEVLARRLALPPYIYTRDIARRPSGSPYVWARNLLANRLYQCPVVFLEPYAMNSEEVWARVQAGEYEGERDVAGRRCPSIFREYAGAVTEGLEAYFAKRSRR